MGNLYLLSGAILSRESQKEDGDRKERAKERGREKEKTYGKYIEKTN